MAITLIPYGQLEDGKFGIKLDDVTGVPIATVIEVFTTLPSVADPDNFDGRMGFDKTAQTLYVFLESTPEWFPLEGIPAAVGAVGGTPPTVPTPADGFLFYDTDTEIMYVWDGTAWRPIGGRFAARYIEQITISSGFAGPGGDTFGLGLTPVYAEFVEVFLDGVRQAPNPGGDYNVVGSNVVFPFPVPAAVEVFTRTLQSTVLESPGVLQNGQIKTSFYTATAGQTDFELSQSNFDPAGTFVFVDGLIQTGSGIDYVHVIADTTITAINKVAATTARATTASAHGAGIGDEVEIIGSLEPEFNGVVTITAVPTPSEFEYTIVVTAPAAATPDPILFFTPPFVNDEIQFNNPLVGGEGVQIRSVASLITAPSTGEANTASNLGGGVGLFSVKSGEDLRFKSISAGPNITVLDLGGEVQISTTIGSTFEGRNGINTNVHLLADTESYIGVRDTSFVVLIDVSTVPPGTSGSGRRVVITDESGGAGTNNIQITHPGSTFSGFPSPLLIDADNGSVTIIYDGSDWHITSKTY